MSGVELQYAKRTFPHVNVVMISGNSPPNIAQDTRFFMKPYNSKDLLGGSADLKAAPVFCETNQDSSAVRLPGDGIQFSL